MSGLDFAFGIVLVMTIAIVYLTKVALNRPRRQQEPDGLQEEVEALRQRIGVLERIAVEKENSLEREFELLRR